MKLYKKIALAMNAIENCRDKPSNNDRLENHWLLTHKLNLESLVSEHMPSGSGFDNGTKFNLDRSDSEMLVFHTSFHHMDENGSYDGWTEHTIIIKPSLGFDFDLKILGENRNDIKELIHDVFYESLQSEVR